MALSLSSRLSRVVAIGGVVLGLMVSACSDGDGAGDGGGGGTGGGGGGGGGSGCGGLCKGAGYSGGEEQKFDKVTECLCQGSGSEVAKDKCEGYCAGFGVSAEKSFLSSSDEADQTKKNKCVCDGT